MRYPAVFIVCLLMVLGSALAQGQSEPIKIVIMHTNDVHGGIDRSEATFMDQEFPPALGGGAALAGLVKKVRKQAEDEDKGFLLFDVGDIWQGTPVGNYHKGEIVIEYMNRLGYDAWAPGNHEFDAGLENAFHIMKMAEFPVLAANLISSETGEVPPPIKPYVIREVKGVRIGIIGLITEETPMYALPEDVQEVQFLDVKTVTQKYIAEIKDKVDLIFVVAHLGVPWGVNEAYKEMIETGAEKKIRYGMNAMELVHYVPGIDVLIGGHIHVGYEKGWIDPLNHTICLQTYGRGSGVGLYEIEVDPGTKKIIGYDLAESNGEIVTLFEDEFWPDEDVEGFIQEWVDSAEVGMDEPIGRALIDITRVGVGESQLGDMVTDAMREAVDADVAFTNLGGIRANIAMGIITPRDVFQVVPFENKLTYFEMTGSFLKHVIEWRVKGMRQGAYVSGVKIVYSRTRPDFDRVVELTVNGEPWDPDRIYRVVTTDFIAEGNVGLQILTDVDKDYVTYSDITVKQAVIDYVKKHSPLEPRIEGRFVRDDDRKMSPALAEAMDGYKPLEDLTH
jgi:2',3'-cyclic-nucleotide 2'-phosphodiesterase (5'-nucleotidase family)